VPQNPASPSPSKASAGPAPVVITARAAGSGADPLAGPRFSAIVPTWNEIDHLPELVERLKSSPRVGEVIVADNASADGTPVAALAAGCTVIEGGRPAVGRNAGAGIAHEELLLFVDADAAITSEVIDAIADDFRDGAVVAAHMRLRPLTDRGLVHLYFRVVDGYLAVCERLGRPTGAVGELIAVRKSAFDKAGGFDEDVRAAEDFEFIRRLQLSGPGRVVYNRSLRLDGSARRFDIEDNGRRHQQRHQHHRAGSHADSHAGTHADSHEGSHDRAHEAIVTTTR
jgi:glycosyltransferase involved in cell wall biosynthesis